MRKMKGLLLLCLISMLYAPVVAVAANLVPSVKAMKGELASNRIIVKLKQGVMASAASKIFSSVGVQSEHKFNAVNMSVLNLVKGKQSKAVIRALMQSGIVEFAEPDRMLYINAVPNDPVYPLLWGLNNTGQTFGTVNADIDADLAWDITVGDPNVVVGVIDTGVDYNHPDLAANIWVNPGEIPGNLIDDDGNGYIDDVHGINAVVGSGDPMDDNSHGTHVSGTIGAVGNNNIGVVGVSPQVKIMGLKFLDATGSGSTIDAIECLNYAAMMKSTYGVNVKLTSNSWGGGGADPALLNAIQVNNALDILFIAAAGNNGTNNDIIPSYPSNYDVPNVIAVAATDHNDTLAVFSQFGANTVDLAAPGVDIYSTFPVAFGSYAAISGTSMATPHVSGAAALIWAHNPTATAVGVKGLLLSSVDIIPSLAGTSVTGGRLNVNNAVRCVPGNPTLNISAPGAGFTSYAGVAEDVIVNINDCGVPQLGGVVTVTPSNADAPFNLNDNGTAPDLVANDGIYSGSWMPMNSGAVSLDISAVLAVGTFNGQVSGNVIVPVTYRMKDVPFQWVDISQIGTPVTLADDASVSVPLGFTFNYFGMPYTSVSISSNGFLTFDVAGTTEFNNSALPSAQVPNNVIAAFWDDLNPTLGGLVGYAVEGVAPNRRFTVAWLNIAPYGATALDNGSFEVSLYEGSDHIVIRYLDTVFGGAVAAADNGASATAGIENADGTFGYQKSFNTPNLLSNTAVLFTPDMLSAGVDIKLNGSDTPVPVSPTALVDATVSVNAASLQNTPADWWLWVDTPAGRYWYVHGAGWSLSTVPLVASTGNPLNLSNFSVLNSTLPIGTYSFNFALDNNADGIFDGSNIDWVDVLSQ